MNLIPKTPIKLQDWEECLAGKFSSVWLGHSEILATLEGQSPGALNKMVVEDGPAHLFVLDRPTTIREYEPEELDVLRKVIAEPPEQFFAVDYTDDALLRRVLAAQLQHEGTGKIFVDDDHGTLALLEDFLAARPPARLTFDVDA